MEEQATRLTLEEAANIVQSRLAIPEQRTARPALITISGLPGTGKTYVTGLLARRIPSVTVESDRVRKLLFPKPRYTAPESAFVYGVCHTLIARMLARGLTTIFDATNLTERGREVLYNLAEKAGAKPIMVRVTAPPDVVRQRLNHRGEALVPGELSDADWDVYLKMKDSEERIRRPHIVIDTSKDFRLKILQIVKAASICYNV